MKKVLLSLLFVTSSTVAFAQIEKRDDPQEIDQDKIQQEPQRPSQLEIERSIRIDGQRQQNEKRARKIAKRKSKTTIVEDTLKKN
jgi:hypothetical protein